MTPVQTRIIQAETGHDGLKEVERCTRAADQELLASEAIATMPDTLSG